LQADRLLPPPTLDLDAVRTAWTSRVAAEKRPWLDERTWADLNLDDVVAAIDRTESTLGQAALYHRLRSAPRAEHLEAFETLVTTFSTDQAAKARARRALARLHDAHGYNVWWLARPGAVETRGWYAVFPLLSVGTVTLVALTIVWHALLPAVLAMLAVNLLVHFGAMREIIDLQRSVRQLAPIIATGQDLSFLNAEGFAPITGSLDADASRLRRLKTVARMASEDPLMLSVRAGIGGEIASQFVSAVYEYVNMVLLLDGNAIYFVHRDLAAHRDALLRLVTTVGDIDAALSVAEWRADCEEWSRPQFRPPGSGVAIAAVRHPLIESAVPNEVTLTPGHGLLITGSNMSGKSTFLRTVGVNIVLAQTIHTCLAAAYAAPLIDVQSCIGRSDDLLTGKSYYLVEVEQVVSRLRASAEGAQHLFIFDELFRGTNAIERIAAGEAVLREVLAPGGVPHPHFVIAATHDAELVGLLADLYEAGHFTDTVTAEGLAFEYRLQPGPATTRNAIALLALHGAPEGLVTRALASAARIERQRATPPSDVG
jgi:hypothetical protein